MGDWSHGIRDSENTVIPPLHDIIAAVEVEMVVSPPNITLKSGAN